MVSTGILYIAIGAEYLREAKVSVESLRECMPDVSVALITDQSVDDERFDRVISERSLPDDYGSSTLWPDISPFERTIFLDTDTYVYSDISELFDVLDESDLAAAIAPNQNTVEGVPNACVEYNTGVVSFRSTERVNAFFDAWQHRYETWREERELSRNQPSFTKALYESDLNVCPLATRYNCKSHFPGYLTGEAKVIHGRRHSASLPTVAEALNSTQEKRVHRPRSYFSTTSPIHIYEGLPLRYRLEKSMAHYSGLVSDGVSILRNEGVRSLYRSTRSYLGQDG